MDLEALDALTERASFLANQLPFGEEKERCLNMISTLLENPTWPDLKIGGWLEYITTACIFYDVTSVNTEREFTRPIKHAYYARMGYTIPETKDVMLFGNRNKNDSTMSASELRNELDMLRGVFKAYLSLSYRISDTRCPTSLKISKSQLSAYKKDILLRCQKLSLDTHRFPDGLAVVKFNVSTCELSEDFNRIESLIASKLPR